MAMQASDLVTVNRSVSQCEMPKHLRDRLSYALPTHRERAHLPR